MPNEANYHDDRIQMLILDVLFIYCKLNPGRGGYRQGMHELLAPIVHVLEQDAVKRDSEGNDMLDQAMLETLDAAYIEHDAYALFSKLMEQAQFFYEVKDVAPGMQSFQEASSAIVERSKHIHEVLLNKIDPDLAAHLTNIEILPQIFLMYVVSCRYGSHLTILAAGYDCFLAENSHSASSSSFGIPYSPQIHRST